jgi:hypothetical protein
MKQVVIMLALFSFAVPKMFAQEDHAAHHQKAGATKDTTGKTGLQGLLEAYLEIKDALVAGNAANASEKSKQFQNLASSLNEKATGVSNLAVLAKAAEVMGATQELKQQRELFASFSMEMYNLTKAVKPGTAPIYLQYCPMKKASWLSKEPAIKNPYYGDAMLTCGRVTETLKP